jgi:hypothetical protein
MMGGWCGSEEGVEEVKVWGEKRLLLENGAALRSKLIAIRKIEWRRGARSNFL